MNQIIILNNKSCQYKTDDQDFFNKLRKFLSFKAAGVEWTPAYQNGWDGTTYLMNKKGTFNAGLITKVKDFLYENGVEYTEEDRREPIEVNPEIDLSKKLEQMKMVPREHQVRIIEECLKNRKGIVRACTGSGKTSAIASLVSKLNKTTIIHVIGLDLLKQFHDLFSKLFDEPIGYIGGGECKIERINIATIWTTARALKMDKGDILSDDEGIEEDFDESKSGQILKMLQEAKVHIFDESHIVGTSSIAEIYKNIDPEYIYGFSGTPFRGDNTDLLINGFLGEQIINISASELIEKGILAQPIIKFVPVPKARGIGDTYQEVYKNYVVENDIRNNLIINSVKSLIDKNYVVLVLFKQIKHGKILSELMNECGIKHELLNGNDNLERRNNVKELTTNKKNNVVLASTILDIGFDLPILSALVLAGSGKSSIRATQRCGRVIRGFPGKKQAAIVDFYDQVKFLKNHSKIRYEIYSKEKGFKVLDCKEMR